MTTHQIPHGRDGAVSERTVERPANNCAPDAFTFRAPRFGDLVVCPYCDADTFTCDHCGGSREMFASEFFDEH